MREAATWDHPTLWLEVTMLEVRFSYVVLFLQNSLHSLLCFSDVLSDDRANFLVLFILSGFGLGTVALTLIRSCDTFEEEGEQGDARR
jgi:hypothetical protein